LDQCRAFPTDVTPKNDKRRRQRRSANFAQGFSHFALEFN
jgi:hypothetical protein